MNIGFCMCGVLVIPFFVIGMLFAIFKEKAAKFVSGFNSLSKDLKNAAGSMNSKIAERPQYFGMLRCIGISKAQIRHTVRLEALNWCKKAAKAKYPIQ